MEDIKSGKLVLHSPILRFEIIGEPHFRDVFDSMNCRETAEMISFLTWPVTEAQVRGWVETSIQGLGAGKRLFIAYHQVSGEPVGCICVLPWKDEVSKTEIGYWVTENWKGKGIATEMIRAALDFAFEILKTRAVVATVAGHNTASQAAIRKFGFRAAGEMKKSTAKGTVLDLTIYELLAENWFTA